MENTEELSVGKYIIIYKIDKNKIIILRIFNQRENYLNSNKFILKEESIKYKIIHKQNLKIAY